MRTKDDTKLTPREVRALARDNKLTAVTSALYPDYVKAGLLIPPVAYVDGFLHFASRSSKACPVPEVIREKPFFSFPTPGANLCTDFPCYRVFLNGEVSEGVREMKVPRSIGSVDFLFGCPASFDGALLVVGFPVRHMEEHRAMPTYQIKLRICLASPFRDPVLVSTRPLPQAAVKETYQLTEPMELVYGAPIQIGAPEEIGIADLNKPDFGEITSTRDGETPVFQSSSATVQAALRPTKLPFAITDVPGYPLISDTWNDVLPELFQKEEVRV